MFAETAAPLSSSSAPTRLVLCAALPAGGIAPLTPDLLPPIPGFITHRTCLPLPDCGSDWRVGTRLLSLEPKAKAAEHAPGEEPEAALTVVGRLVLPHPTPQETRILDGESRFFPHSWPCPLLKAIRPLGAGPRRFVILPPAPDREGRRRWSLAWITVSDKGASNLRRDESGPLMAALTRAALPLHHEAGFLLPDNAEALRALVLELSLGQGYDLILTSGGTGLSPRDTTPEALLPLFDRRLPGFEQAMMTASLGKTPAAAISRAVSGTIGKSLVLTLPGSRNAVRENLEAVLPVLPHALEKLHGNPSPCGSWCMEGTDDAVPARVPERPCPPARIPPHSIRDMRAES